MDITTKEKEVIDQLRECIAGLPGTLRLSIEESDAMADDDEFGGDDEFVLCVWKDDRKRPGTSVCVDKMSVTTI